MRKEPGIKAGSETKVEFPIPDRLLYRFMVGAVRSGVGIEEEGYSTEPDSPKSCPWCGWKFLDLWCLLKHLRCFHSRFDFVYKPSTNSDELPVIDVHVNSNFDTSYEGQPIRQYSIKSDEEGPSCMGSWAQVLVWKGNKCDKYSRRTLKEFSEPEFSYVDRKRGHVRQYFHSKTRQPVKNLTEKEDSESERDPEWFRESFCRQIDDFSDLNEGEKEFLKMWNLNAVHREDVTDSQMGRCCEEFVEEHGRELVEKQLMDNCALHFAQLEYLGLLTRKNVRCLTMLLKSLIPKSEPPPIIIDLVSSDRRRKQREKRVAKPV